MKRFVLPIMAASALATVILIAACEKHKDPFSAQNLKPVIADFRFKPDPNLPNIRSDSLKFKAGASYKLYLKYEDREFSSSTTKKLQALFSFESGSGKISHDQFTKPSDDGLRFGEVPGKFDDDLLFTPDAPGVVRLRLQLSDGVKSSETQQASVTFFENLKPVPAFTVRLLTQTNPYVVEFNPERSQDRDGDINKATFIWSFGDNSEPITNIGKTLITHPYKNAGQYRVRLRIIDEESKADSTEQLVTTANQPPVAALRITPTSGKVPLEIDYTATGSFDPDGMISSYQLFFGDGEASQNATGKHIYKTDANYQVILIVKDNLGLADTANVSVRVSTPPIAVMKITPESGGPVPLRLVINGKDSRDPHPGGSITAYRITLTNLATNAQQLFPQDSVSTLITSPANYLIALEVTNIRGLTSRAEKVVPAGLPGISQTGDGEPSLPVFRKP
jgi:PKD repeat protein